MILITATSTKSDVQCFSQLTVAVQLVFKYLITASSVSGVNENL